MTPFELNWLELAARLAVAMGAGMVIGIDREWRHKAAGMRTHMLVAISVAAVTILAVQLGDGNASRILQGVVTGIGFIGAGAILHHKHHTEGVTTAASIWACAVLGMVAGVGFYRLLVVTLVLVMFILIACGVIESLLYMCQGPRPPRPPGAE